MQLLSTHLGLRIRERRMQIQTLLGPDWLGHPDCKNPVVLCDDLNFLPGSYEYRHLCRRLQDSRRVYAKTPVRPTWMGVAQLDYVMTTPGLEIVNMHVPRTDLTRRASDHAPLIVDVQLMAGHDDKLNPAGV